MYFTKRWTHCWNDQSFLPSAHHNISHLYSVFFSFFTLPIIFSLWTCFKMSPEIPSGEYEHSSNHSQSEKPMLKMFDLTVANMQCEIEFLDYLLGHDIKSVLNRPNQNSEKTNISYKKTGTNRWCLRKLGKPWYCHTV